MRSHGNMLLKRGISGREAGSKCNDRDTNVAKLSITLENVHNCSTFELRQELKGRGYFLDDYEGPVNYTILLEKLVQLLQKEKEGLESKRLHALARDRKNGSAGETLEVNLAREKEERKAAAMERSRQRQRNKDYFESKKKLNKEGKETLKDKFILKETGESSENVDVNPIFQPAGEEKEETRCDPFALRFRPKISGRYA